MNQADPLKILVTRRFPDIAVDMLEAEGFSVTAWDQDRPMTEAELITGAKKHDVLLCTLTERIDKAFLQACSHLKMISQFAVGYDNIDINAATRMGIPVGYTPGAMSDATADTAFGLMIAVSRKMIHMHKKILDSQWSYFNPTADLGFELKNKTLGIFGMGRIGMETARRCKGAYDMEIIYHNRRRNLPVETELDAEYVSFEQLLEKCDILSVHCVLSDETRGIFNKTAFQKMKKTSVFINTARGPVHNEADLIEALESGSIWGAGLDVTDPEPMKADNPLLSMENVAVLPHIGSATIEARGEMARLAAVNIISFFKDNSVPHIVNPEVFKKR